ncbi:hypothetical protein [Streptomyces sp. NBC_01244]|uniref:hypothetical protein n=1 Tax=Streptomyces sp. NBC_01244 TaxID=2903797 RepID=UPI002E113BC8|nr:hypothetical protein OG247_43765 [Streptomyces sp. NBC_01244]
MNVPVVVFGTPVVAAIAVWFFVGIMRVQSYRAKNIAEGMTPQWLVNRRLIQGIRARALTREDL